MAIFQIKVSYISKNQQTTSPGKTEKNLSYISRGTNGRALASIKYIAREGQYKDRDDLIFYEEKNIPEVFKDSKELIQNLEEQSRNNARLLKKYQMSLPREFDDKKNLEIAKEFLDKQFGKDCTYFWAMHNPKGIHPHIHVSVVERNLNDKIERPKEILYKTYNHKNPEKGGLKVMDDCDKKEYFDKLCETWENTLNKHLELNGFDKIKPKDIEVIKEKEEKIFYSKEVIKNMSAVETKDVLLNLENRKNKNEKERKKLYQKNIEKAAMNKMTDNRLYKLENKIKGLNTFKYKKDIGYEKKLSVLKQIKILEAEKEKIINDCKNNPKFDKIKSDIKIERDLKIKSLNKENKKIEGSIKKIIKTQTKKNITKIEDSLRKNIENKSNEYIKEEARQKIEKIYSEQTKEKNRNFDEEKAKKKEHSNNKKTESDNRKNKTVKTKTKSSDMKEIRNAVVSSSRVLGTIKSAKSALKTIVKNESFGNIISLNRQKRYEKISGSKMDDVYKKIDKDMQQEKEKNRSR